ncbi:hypothetical protein C0Q70_12766 [Pomacea canaliculata]|uniref:Chitin-binding type-2 domain-containing protein n=1 Tax=Pomacea canaliculata TaxID=400727 RepID=A0A2T7P2F0_POMCA|nr:hypothetical protein C0Q70_12766 [Pomacea canaliculata]
MAQAKSAHKYSNYVYECVHVWVCMCAENCVNTDKCCHSRDPALGRAVEEMTELAKEMYDIFLESCSSCPRDGGWSEWCEWGSCSVSCGEGTRTRRRQCDSPTPKANGRPCQGLAMDSIPCSGPACCIDGNWAAWSSWSSCPVTCGRGSVDRYRTCSNPAPNYCGQTCPGLAREARSCEVGDCCVDGNWADWSSWSSCPVTCGRGTVDRYRTCNNPSPNYCGQTCPGPSRDMRACEVGDCCVDGEWGSWLSWSACSATCGSGSQSRMRRCDSPSPNFCGRRCPGPASEMKTCVSERDCCVDGNWGQWDPWSPCSASCGLAVRERERRCNNPAPNYCGQSCPGFDVQEETCSRLPACAPTRVLAVRLGPEGPPGHQDQIPRVTSTFLLYFSVAFAVLSGDDDIGGGGVDGNWADWSSWSSCPVTCGRGTVDRYRTCSNPAPNYCGQTCPGPSRDMRACELERVVDGQWGEWWRWSSCSATCERGTRERTRSCDSPSPNVCGRTCPGPKVERDTCDTGIPCAPVCVDGNWGQWERWGGCSVTCGQGIRDRRRQCDSPAPNFCGQSCPGSGVDRGTCDTRVPCPPDCVDGNWGQWERWGGCSATCGQGSRDRRRQCDSPAPNFCGQSCPGSGVDRDTCDTRVPCPPECVNGNWGLWGTWSACPVTCGQAQRERRRQCDSPSPNFCGETCPGLPVERIQFRCGPDEVAGNWESWQAWGACSVTCGRGQQLRRRVCDVAELNECVRPCPGSEMERRECGRDCCVDGNWGQWERWGGCSVTCGQGSRERRRQCDSPAPNFCGQSCPGSGVDRDTCDTRVPCQPYCVDGNWGLWESWGACPVTCGLSQRERRRVCDSPPPNVCGKTCPGPSFERASHSCGPMEVDGNWGSWSTWSPCPVTCGQGQRERRRLCDSPSPNVCGRTCPGPSLERTVQLCGPEQVDGQWGMWGSWSACPVTCGMGQVERRRFCDAPAPNACGRSCPGPAIEQNRKQCGPEAIDGNWGSWEQWGACSATCGFGRQNRRRRCDSPSASECGRPCRGSDVDIQECNLRPCCAERQWSTWTQWSACSATCGPGTRTRQRTCQSVGFGEDCEPLARVRRSRQLGARVSGNANHVRYTNWEPWCPCDCRKGISSRRRTCVDSSGNKVDIQNCGSAQSREERKCDVREVCPVCVFNCTNRLDGNYTSCSSCQDYVQCRSGQLSLFSCTADRGERHEWDAFIGKCRPGDSPSCSLQPCVSSCVEREDGPAPSCFGCSSYLQCQRGRDTELNCPPDQEFNAHSGQCERAMSPTCIRPIIRRAEFMFGDAPADSYFNMEEEDAEDRYEELLKETGVIATLGRDNQDARTLFNPSKTDDKDDELDNRIAVVDDG